MPRIQTLDTKTAPAETQQTLSNVQKMLGATPNLFRTVAHSQVTLDALAGLFVTLGKGQLKARTREAIALHVAELNGCDYCLSAHTALGKGAGLTDGELSGARTGQSADAKTRALLRFTEAVVTRRGDVSNAELAAVRDAGATDAEVLETIANVVLNIFTNYVNVIAETDIDFPVVRAGGSKAA